MAGLAALLGYTSGSATGKHDAYVDAMNRAQQDARDAEHAREFDVDSQMQQSTIDRQNRYTDAQIKNYDSLSKERDAKVKQINAKVAGTDPETAARVRELTARGDLDGAIVVLDQAKTGLTNAQTGKTNAETWNIKYERPREFNAKIASVEKMLDARLGTQKDIALRQIASRGELAQYNAGARMDIARLALAGRMYGADESAAVRSAIDQYNQGMMNYRSATDPRRALLADPNAPTPTMPAAPVMPTINLNLGGLGFGQGYTPPAGALPPIPNTGNASNGTRRMIPPVPPKRNPAPGQAATPVLSPEGMKALGNAREALNVLPLEKTIEAIKDPKVYPKLSPAERAAIIKAISPQQLPVGGFKGILNGQGAGGSPPLPF